MIYSPSYGDTAFTVPFFSNSRVCLRRAIRIRGAVRDADFFVMGVLAALA
jgi:hypothetical protein